MSAMDEFLARVSANVDGDGETEVAMNKFAYVVAVLYKSLIIHGFNEEQAFELVETWMTNVQLNGAK